jgi:hypothetical protein
MVDICRRWSKPPAVNRLPQKHQQVIDDLDARYLLVNKPMSRAALEREYLALPNRPGRPR